MRKSTDTVREFASAYREVLTDYAERCVIWIVGIVAFAAALVVFVGPAAYVAFSGVNKLFVIPALIWCGSLLAAIDAVEKMEEGDDGGEVQTETEVDIDTPASVPEDIDPPTIDTPTDVETDTPPDIPVNSEDLKDENFDDVDRPTSTPETKSTPGPNSSESRRAVLAALEDAKEPALTTGMVADRVEFSRKTVHTRLNELATKTEVESSKIGGATAYWLPAGSRSEEAGSNQ